MSAVDPAVCQASELLIAVYVYICNAVWVDGVRNLPKRSRVLSATYTHIAHLLLSETGRY